MKRYLPAKRAMVTFYLLLAAGGTALNFVLYRYVSVLSDELLRIISAAMWFLILVVAVAVIPHYFIHSKVIITKNELAAAGGFITYKNDYMPIGSIKSVSVIITPLGGITGFNFVTVNALGSRMLLCFLKKEDVKLIAKNINEMILAKEDGK